MPYDFQRNIKVAKYYTKKMSGKLPDRALRNFPIIVTFRKYLLYDIIIK